jgi:hexosaminidase
MSEILLLPQPQTLIRREGTAVLSERKAIALDVAAPNRLLFTARLAQRALGEHAGLDWFIAGGATLPEEQIGLIIRLDLAMSQPQGYRLRVDATRIQIEAADDAGAFYGVQTLIQLLQEHGAALPCLQIEDWPDLRDRGVMLDISRDKVPTMDTLYALIDLLASWKINQFQLYTEHTFAYRNHPDVWANASPITAEEILMLDAYCRERFIDLVPNQNCFGHMHRWFEHPQYLALAEAPNGFTTPQGLVSTLPFSLDPTDPDSIDLVASLFAELLPNFGSTMVNVNCDETFELGLGKSKALCEARGKGRVYLDFLLQVFQQAQAHGRTMQFWADIVGRYPDLVPELPPSAIALEWGYEADHPFAAKCHMFAAAGVPFYVCPGTSSWNSIAGRTGNALANIRNAVENGIEHGALGVLNTDWGDGGHWQQLPISYLGWAYAAGLGWAIEQNVEMDVTAVLDAIAFNDRAQVMGKLVYDLGNAFQWPDFPVANGSILFWAFTIPLDMMSRREVSDEVKAVLRRQGGEFTSKLRQTIGNIDEVMAPLDKAQMDRVDAELIKEELRLAAAMLKHGARRWLAILGDESPGRAELEAELAALKQTYERLWLERNRPGGLADSLDRMSRKRPLYPGIAWDNIFPGVVGLP